MHSLLSFCGRDFISLASLSVRGRKRERVVVQSKIALFPITCNMFNNGVLMTCTCYDLCLIITVAAGHTLI